MSEKAESETGKDEKSNTSDADKEAPKTTGDASSDNKEPPFDLKSL